MIGDLKAGVRLRIIQTPIGAYRWAVYQSGDSGAILSYGGLFLTRDRALEEGYDYCKEHGFHVEF